MPKLPLFTEVLRQLEHSERPLSPRALQTFSDINPQNLQALQKIWPVLPLRRKYGLLENLAEQLDEDGAVDYADLATWALNDSDGGVRYRALELLRETEDPRLLPGLSTLTASDPEENVRARAASRLGNFLFLAEVEEVPAAIGQQAFEALQNLYQNGSPALQRAALEALGSSSQASIPPLIEAALQKADLQWQVSALRAIGKSADERWNGAVLSRLNDLHPEVRLAAVQAAGSLGLKNAKDALLALLNDAEEEDNEILASAIWSLSELGGEDVREALVSLYDAAEEAEDDELAAFLEEALENLDFTEDAENFQLMAFDPEEDEPR